MNRLTIVPVLLLALRPAPAGACSCALPPPVAEAFAEYDAAFIGRAVSYRPIWLSALGSGRAVTFEVEEAWKGISGQRVEVKTGSIYGSCGIWPEDGERLIVFASRWEEGLYMGICSNTTSDAQAIEQARAEIAATGAEPIELTAGPDPEFGPPLLPLCGAGVPAALGVFAIGVLPLGRFTRPRRKPWRATKRVLALLPCLAFAVKGCSCGAVIPPDTQVIGVDTDAVLYVSPVAAPEDQTTSPLYRLDLDTGSQTVVLDAVPNLSGPGPISGGPMGAARGYGRVVSDGKHVAWIDQAANDVKVRDLDTGTVTSHFSGLPADLHLFFSLAELRDGTLTAHYSKAQFPGAGTAFSSDHFGLVDLATGALREIPDIALYGDFALGDGHFAFFTGRDGGSLIQPVIDRLEVMNLATGVRTTVVEDLNVRGFSSSVFIASNLLVWDGQPIRTFNLVTGERQTPIDTLAGPGEGAGLLGFNGQHLLVQKSPDSAFTGYFLPPEWPVRLDLVDWEGRADPIASDTATRSTLPFWDARLVGSYVVWIDDNPDEFVIYDTRHRNTRRVPAIPE